MSSERYKKYTEQIKAEALRLGFSACGIAPADDVGVNSVYLSEWLKKGNHGGISYMENHFDKRVDPRLLVEGTRSIISLALNYFPSRKLDNNQYQFAWYAYGKDYHDIMRVKLDSLYNYIHENIQPVNGRAFCDTAPVLERYWAWRAGLGWIGKNTQLIIPGAGSYFFLGEIFLDLELLYDEPKPNRCGDCSLCLQHCPTGALEQPFELNCRKCLSYLTIENRDEIPPLVRNHMGNRIYGCDQCQESCPWNRFASPTKEPGFEPSEAFITMNKDDWDKLTEEQYNEIFRGSAVKRAKYSGLMRNIRAVKDQP